MAYKILVCLAVLAASSATKDQSRWSRQISSYTSDISDWVPLTGPVERKPPVQLKRQIAEPRILSEPVSSLAGPAEFNDAFSSRGFYNSPGGNRQLYLQSVPSAPQNYLTDQGFNQGFKFGLSQPNFPLTQGFVAPPFNFNNVPQLRPKPQVPNPVRFESFPQPIQPLPPLGKPIFNQAPKLKPEVPKYVDGYRVENISNYHVSTSQQKPQSLQKIRFEEFDKSKEILSAPKAKTEREEVQLLYVPVDSLNRGQFNFRSPITSPQILNTELYSQFQKQNPPRGNFGNNYQRPNTKPFTHDVLQSPEFMSNFNSPINGQDAPNFSTLTSPFTTLSPTTPKPKKLKPHQPPLAIFLSQNANRNHEIKVGDVLNSLKSAKSVAVLDSVNPVNAPEVFIGPSSLTPPDNYVRFDLPYLSNIENKDKKLKQLPFFVAPLSYNTPHGFAKIPFPSPHVGSVVINSQIQEVSSSTRSPIAASVFPNSYNEPSIYKEQQTVTQKPKSNYYSTVAPKENYVNNYEQNYYSFEPQTISTLREFNDPKPKPAQSPPKTSSYFLSNVENQFNPSQYSNFQQPDNQNQKTPSNLNYKIPTSSGTTTTIKPPSTYPSQLSETHNPYSINQAFQFSTHDYQNVFDEYKEPYATQELKVPLPSAPTPGSYSENQAGKFEDTKIQKPSNFNQFSTPSYQQNYSPEIHYQSEIQPSQYPGANSDEFATKTARPQQNDYIHPAAPLKYNDDIKSVEEQPQRVNNAYKETQANYTDTVSSEPDNQLYNIQAAKPIDEYNSQYDSNSYSSEEAQSSTTTTTTTTTTRRTPVRTRGRPRYPTTKPTESSEYSTRAVVTRKPLRERRPLPNRPRYEPNRVTSERTTRKPIESSESTTKSFKPRIRGKLHYKPSEGEEVFEKQTKHSSKEADLAYQRDILHQNYPVTLMERASTVDIEAITEPTGKADSTYVDNTKTDDTENAYSYDKLSITEHVNSQIKDVSQYTSAVESDTDIYVPKTNSEDTEYYQPRTVTPPQKHKYSYESKDVSYSSQATPEVKIYEQDSLDSKTDNSENEQDSLDKNEYSTETQEKVTISSETEITKTASSELSQEQEQGNVIETTPSYNRVRIRPGVIRQHHTISSTESSRIKHDRRNNATITYRPAFDRRRTTMRIEEIEADLKTKQVHSRPEFKDYRQPVYKPDPVTEPPSSTTEATTKRSQYRRKRPTYTTTSTEGSINRRPYEVKNRFRGRRPTDKPTEKPDIQTDVTTTTTVRTNSFNKYNHRPRLSERYNKKPEKEEEVVDDQDSNYSLHRPKYTKPEAERWSAKISGESFKPFNPNDIVEEEKSDKSEQKDQEEELDIITAKNEDVLISVTPATNNRVNKNIDDIPPTIEALVENTKETKGDTGETAPTFESMLEEVMKSLEEQDEDEYTNKVKKHKGGEIGEIPPERIISSGVNYSLKSTKPPQDSTTVSTLKPDNSSTLNNNEKEETRKSRRRGYWKKVKIGPATDGIDVAESQYYSDTVNSIGENISKQPLDKSSDKTRFKVTTYKPKFQFVKDFFESAEENILPHIDLPKLNSTSTESSTEASQQSDHLTTQPSINKETPTDTINPGDMDLGTGTPDPTYDDSSYYSEPTEPTSTSTKVDRSDKFSFMDYLFGVTSADDSEKFYKNDSQTEKGTEPTDKQQYKTIDRETHQIKSRATTESAYIPEEITAESRTETTYVTEAVENTPAVTNEAVNAVNVESSSLSSYMDPTNIVSTSMSTEISHETEICFRGKCIKTNRDIL